MDFDTRGFRKALGSFPTGIVVVTAGPPERYRGITVNSFASLSLDPPLVLWCIARTSRRYETFTMASEFTVSVLGEGQRAASDRIAVAGEGDLGDIALETVTSGPPAIAGCLAVFECTREAIHDGGDHVIIVGRVQNFRHREDGTPLTFFRGRYGKMEE
jgi:flavin reductase (DIM6/NTAB) family NADH-FMN oxidoreductase RutF